MDKCHNNQFYYSVADNKFIAVDLTNFVIIGSDSYEKDSMLPKTSADLFKFIYKESIDTRYSNYLTESYVSPNSLELSVSTGLDVGEHEEDLKVNYVRTDVTEGQNVIIRTNSDDSAVTIDAPIDTVKHSGICGTVTIKAVDSHSYYESGKVSLINISGNGHIKLLSSCEVKTVYFSKSEEKDATGADTFSNISLSLEEGVEMPEFGRDEITINKDNGTKIAQVEIGGESKCLWLFQDGIYEQIKITSNSTSTNGEWIDSSNVSNEIKEVATQIANSFISSTRPVWSTDDEDRKIEDATNKETILSESGKTDIEELINHVRDSKEEIIRKNSFESGSGTESDPYIIANRKQLELIPTDESKLEKNPDGTLKYVYYKLLEGVEIDCSGWVTPALYGSLDGNGAKLNNLTTHFVTEPEELLNKPSYDKMVYVGNFTINANINGNQTISAAVMLRMKTNNLTLENITVHGYIEDDGATVFIRDICTTSSEGYRNNIIIKDCFSDATVVARSSTASGFFGWIELGGNITSDDKFIFINSQFVGNLVATENKGAVKARYFGDSTGQQATRYATLTVDEASSKYNGVNLFSQEISSSHTIEEYTYSLTIDDHPMTSTFTFINDTSNSIAIGGTFQVDKNANAVSAKATLIVAPDGNQVTIFGGTYTTTYLFEELTPSNSKFVTSKIKYFNVDVNAAGKTETGIDGNYLHIVNPDFNNHYSAYYVTITQYDEHGNVVQVNRWQFPKNY